MEVREQERSKDSLHAAKATCGAFVGLTANGHVCFNCSTSIPQAVTMQTQNMKLAVAEKLNLNSIKQF